MKLSIRIPDDWGASLRDLAHEQGYKSVQGLLEGLLAKELGAEPPEKATWGGRRRRNQVPHVPQDAPVEDSQAPQDAQDAEFDLPVPHQIPARKDSGSFGLTPNDIIRQRKAEARAKMENKEDPK